MSNALVDNIGNASGSLTTPTEYVVRGSAKAWANLNGTGTIALRDSLNVSSVVDNGTGDYTFNWSSALADQNYACSGHANRTFDNGSTTVGQQLKGHGTTTQLAGSFRVQTGRHGSGFAVEDFEVATVTIQGDLA